MCEKNFGVGLLFKISVVRFFRAGHKGSLMTHCATQLK